MRFENGGTNKYEFDSLSNLEIWIENEVEKFKINNQVRDEYKDKSFLNFKKEMEKLRDSYG